MTQGRVTSAKFSINVNGGIAGYLTSARGRPMSSYLFVIAMECLSSIIKNKIRANPQFTYHWRCQKLNIM